MNDGNDFDVLAVLRDAIAQSPDPSPYTAALQVAAAVPDNQLRLALTQALHRLAPTVAGTQRRHALNACVSTRWHGDGAKTYRRLVATDAYQQLLDAPVPTGTGWKRFRDCARDDLLHAANVRYRQAAANTAAGQLFEKFVAALDECGAVVVADLPVEIGEQIASSHTRPL